jgi:hypothetical protein
LSHVEFFFALVSRCEGGGWAVDLSAGASMVFLRRRSLLLKTLLAIPVVWFLVAMLYSSSSDKSHPHVDEPPPEHAAVHQEEKRVPPRLKVPPKQVEEPEVNLPDPKDLQPPKGTDVFMIYLVSWYKCCPNFCRKAGLVCVLLFISFPSSATSRNMINAAEVAWWKSIRANIKKRYSNVNALILRIIRCKIQNCLLLADRCYTA